MVEMGWPHGDFEFSHVFIAPDWPTGPDERHVCYTTGPHEMHECPCGAKRKVKDG